MNRPRPWGSGVRGRGVRAVAAGPLLVLALASGIEAQERMISCPAPEGLVGALQHPAAAVRYLADDRLGGRLSGTIGERCAAGYIEREFRRIGLAPGGIEGGYLQPVPLRSALNPHAPEGVGMNVVGVLEGSDPDLRAEAIVIGAHHDHLGRGDLFGSLAGPDDPLAGQVHNGADDNASGVGVLLAAAERLAGGPRPARTIVFVTFSGEESGLLGSALFAAEPTASVERMVAMVNLDMVGRLERDPLIVNGTGTAEEWNEILDVLEGQTGIPLARSSDGFGPSDHTSFYARDVPVLHLFTNVHGEYHHPADDFERVDFEGMERITELVLGIVREVDARTIPIVHLAGAGAPPSTEGGYGAYLGTVPDFAPVDFGVRLSGVSGGSPAERVGMRPGDILVRLGDIEIADLYALTDALREIPPGTEVEAVFLRDGEEQRVRVTLEAR